MQPQEQRHVAFVRAIMVGREGLHREVLLDLFAGAGARDVRNHLATGNVSFSAEDAAIEGIVGQVEAGLAAVAGRPKKVFVRSIAALRALAATDPFAGAPAGHAERDVVFLPHAPPPLELPIVSRSGRMVIFAARGAEIFSASLREPDRSPEGPVAPLERLLGVPATARVWTTIEKVLRANPD